MTEEIVKEKCRKFIVDLIFDLVAGSPKKFCMINGNGKWDPDNHVNPYKDMNDMIDKVSNNLFIFMKNTLSDKFYFVYRIQYEIIDFYCILKQIPLLRHISLYYAAQKPIIIKIKNIMMEYKKMLYIDCISAMKYSLELVKLIVQYLI
jgi:hypothetical protein